MENPIIFVRLATSSDIKYVNEIIAEMETSAIIRGSGIAKRSPDSISERIRDGKAIIAVTSMGKWVGFSYLEAWENQRFVSNSGLIVSPQFRNSGVASAIKKRIFSLSRRLYPDARIFSITSGLAILKMNSRLGFEPVTYDQITKDEAFWEGCKSCINYSILEGKKSAIVCAPPCFLIQQKQIPLLYQNTSIENCLNRQTPKTFITWT